MIELRQSTAGQEVPLGYFLDSTNGNDEETGLTIANTDIKIWKWGATTLANKNSGGATHISNGIYYAVLDATDTDTLGALIIFVHVAGALACKVECTVLTTNVWDSKYSTDKLEVDVTQLGGDTQSATDLKDFADAGYDPATNKVEGVKLADVTTANTDMVGTDGANTVVPDAAGTAPTAAEIQTEMEENGASLLDIIRDDLDNATDGLGALKTLIDDVPTVAEFEARSDVAGTAATPAEVATALTTYDGPTKAEMDTAHALLATVAKQDVIDGIVDNILLDTGTDGVVLKAAGLAADAVDEILDEVVEGTLTLRHCIKIILAALAGKSTGGGTTTANFRDNADSKNRIIATVDANGNRTAMTLDGA